MELVRYPIGGEQEILGAQLGNFGGATEIEAASYIYRFGRFAPMEHADPTTPKPGETHEDAGLRCEDVSVIKLIET